MIRPICRDDSSTRLRNECCLGLDATQLHIENTNIYATIKAIDFDTITTDSSERYKVTSEDRHRIVAWSHGESIEISGFAGDVTIKNTSRGTTVKARRW
jgi:hypothetical protein